MNRLLLSSAALAAVISTVAATSPAQADPFHLIRWSDTGYCQVWDDGVPTAPWPANYAVVSMQIPTFGDALDVKYHLLQSGTCSF